MGSPTRPSIHGPSGYLGAGGWMGCNPARTGKAGAGCWSQTKVQ
jgi:hypothetical protein